MLSVSSMNKSRVLIVDDDQNNLRLVAMLLTRCSNCEVRTENRPYAAKAAAMAFLPELIMLDVDMPGKDGGQVAAEIKADPMFEKVPIIFLTSLISPNETGGEMCMRGGMPFLSKPVNPKLLDRTIKSLLGKTEAIAPKCGSITQNVS